MAFLTFCKSWSVWTLRSLQQPFLAFLVSWPFLQTFIRLDNLQQPLKSLFGLCLFWFFGSFYKCWSGWTIGKHTTAILYTKVYQAELYINFYKIWSVWAIYHLRYSLTSLSLFWPFKLFYLFYKLHVDPFVTIWKTLSVLADLFQPILEVVIPIVNVYPIPLHLGISICHQYYHKSGLRPVLGPVL